MNEHEKLLKYDQIWTFIGPILDGWEDVPNDVKCECALLEDSIRALDQYMEDEQPEIPFREALSHHLAADIAELEAMVKHNEDCIERLESHDSEAYRRGAEMAYGLCIERLQSIIAKRHGIQKYINNL